MNAVNVDGLNGNGLNMQAIFNLSDLPQEIYEGVASQVAGYADYRQLILIAHGGRRMWGELQGSEFNESADPVDYFSVDRVQGWLAEQAPGACYEIIYPASPCVVPLQALGELAGWHHSSPFMVGINQLRGSWFAYRVAVITDTDFEPTNRIKLPSPCDSCDMKPCIKACPAEACGDFVFQRCADYRLTDDSLCERGCLARLACPVASEQRYSMEQNSYHYGHSMQTIRDYQKEG